VVSRQAVSGWIAGFALLVGALPTAACAPAMRAADCCPDTTAMPCEDSSHVGPRDRAAACCVQSPATAQPAAMAGPRLVAGDESDPRSPDQAFAPVQSLGVVPTAPLRVSLQHPAALRSADLTPVYLRTGRLRL
jgi:hypothetical protein